MALMQTPTMQTPTTPSKRGYSADRPAVLNRLRRIEGQLRGVARMVEEGRYCIDVLTQIGAVRSALDGVGLGLLDSHVRHCVAAGDPALLEERAEELVGALAGGGRPSYEADTAVLGERLNGLVSRAGRLIGMVEADRYCIDVIEEINEVKKGLDGVALGLVDGHVRSCMSAPAVDDRVAKAGELMAAVGRLVKTT
jgi:CsoR family transcriptional regulator, copper-sensing transcriptional repressor